MKNNKLNKIITLFFLALVLISSPKVTLAYNEYQKCDKGSTCTVGEFLYDDSYVPIATADCTFTSRYPDGSLFVNSDTMDSQSDGWYSYLVVASGSAGLYRSQVCCTAGADYLCLDKSFKVEATTSALTKTDVSSAVWDEPRASHTQSGSFGEALQNIVPSTSDIASAVWGYSGRTLNNFGTLPTDVWSYSSRTLSSFGSLIASIWSNDERTITGGGNTTTTNNYTTNNSTTNSIDTSSLAKKTDVDSLKQEVAYSQSLLEKMVNKPVIKNFLEEEPDVNLESKLNQSQLLLTKLVADSYSMDSKLGMLDIKWKEFDDKKLALVIKEITKLNDSIYDSTGKVKKLWNLALADSLNSQAGVLKSRTTVIESDMKVEGKSKIVKEDIVSLSMSLDGFINTLGTASDSSSKETLYGKVNEVKTLADKFDLYLSDVDKLLADWRKTQLADMQKKTDTIAADLAKISKLPRSISIVTSQPEDSLNKKLKNRLLSIRGAIEANKIYLAKISDKPFSSSWLEEGSVVFKTLLTNPSTRISQSVPLKYYLPTEIKKADIIEVDDDLKVSYDIEKKQLYVEGEFTLNASESKVVSVRVQDIWLISEDSIETLRHQAEELVKPLEKTVYFGQGVTIKSSIDVTLDKILNNQISAITPENKIKNYYEAQIELKAVREQISKLEDLVTQSGSFGSMAGFVGGSQAIAVWGLIIIMVAGFVFLVIYMRVLRGKEEAVEEPSSKKKKKTKEDAKHITHQGFGRGELVRFASIFFIMGSAISFLTSFVVFKAVASNNQSVNKATVKAEEKTVSPIPDKEVLGVEKSAFAKASADEEKTITITDLSGGQLNIRKTPDGEIIGKARSGEKYPLVKEEGEWAQIKLQDGSGWVAKEFIDF
ncbi:MAG: hypothetical protein UR68_C0015G0012 [Candidatus Roizmanbacteria bacterium GW2011_GWA2_35_19]|uniref:SH3b domain-containing protein n=1 Tax=Candidatus Roizmanbacteria bacterium GW2011_GWA2_35_19 TaxID=1618478 RepID=A0A0G0C8G8_9BACT|nr:MAG: hypothetical protein UR68_C0015G0012 [Candidatus Roizmanbacteria bacterium GW2011_GWA2_35_19]